MNVEHVIMIAISIIVGVVQGSVLIFMKMVLGKLGDICQRINSLEIIMPDKVSSMAHEKIELKLGKFGDRILRLEMKIKVVEEREEENQ